MKSLNISFVIFGSYQMFCPYCLKAKVKVVADSISNPNDQITVIKTSDGRVIPNIHALGLDGRFKDDFNQSQNIQYWFYKCPRCKGRFKTKEIIEYYDYSFSPNQEDIEVYDIKLASEKTDKIVKEHPRFSVLCDVSTDNIRSI